jgi:fatty-acyl-CoA synthase
VLWRQGDFLPAALGFRRKDGHDFAALDEVIDLARTGRLRALPAAPFMHGAAHWNALSAWLSGGTVVVQDEPHHLGPADVFRTCERERVTSLLIVGDAFARPLVDELRRHDYELGELRFLLTGGAILSASTKTDLLDLLPGLTIVDILGSSESGRQGVTSTRATDGPADGAARQGRFEPTPSAALVSGDLTRVLAVDDHEEGWLAQRGRVPLGYLGDPTKTTATFPTIDGERYAVPGDRARYDEQGWIELHGRESVTINSGGEKIFAEEVEHALKAHPAVFDAVVVGRPSERWGQEVVALVRLREGSSATDDDLLEVCGDHIARYKLPKAILRLDHIERSPSGKADYRWAQVQAATAATSGGVAEGPSR